MSRRVRVECCFEVEIEDLPAGAAGSAEELRDHGAHIGRVTGSARAAVESLPGVKLAWWTDRIMDAEA